VYEIGDTYTQTFTITDATGVLEDPSPVACTITLPDLTTATATLNHVSLGVYQALYIITQVGQHSLVLTGTVSGYTFTQSDVFNVAAGASSTFVVSLADARTAVGLPSTDVSKDEALRTVIAGATPVMEDLIGPIVPTPRSEVYDGGRTQIALLYAPVMSITSIIESFGSNYQQTLILQDIFASSDASPWAYTVDLATGIVTRRAAGMAMRFAPGERNIQINYVTGRVLKGNQILAARRLIRHLWQTEQQGFRPQMGAPETAMASTPSGFAVPKAVIELCGPDTRPPGIG
jgi:hypothetical protein